MSKRSNRHVREDAALPGDVIRTNPVKRPFKLAEGRHEVVENKKKSPDVIRTKTQDGGRSRRPSDLVTCLSPNRVSESTRTLEVPDAQWKAVLKVSARAGYAVQERNGFDPDGALWFRKALAHALTKQIVPGDLQEVVEKIIAFLHGDARFGFGVSGRWRG